MPDDPGAAAYAALFAGSPDAILLVDDAGRYVDANPAACCLLGRAREDLLGSPVSEVLAADPGAFAAMREAFSAAGQWRGELELRRADGTVVPVDAWSVTIPGPTGPLHAMFARDASARRAAEDALRAREADFRAAFTDAAVGAALVDLDGRVLRANRALAAMLGYAEDALPGLSVADLSHPDDFAADLDQVRRLVAGDIVGYELDKRYVRRDGTIIRGHLSATLVRDAGGAPRHVIAQVQDVTARAEAEDALRRSETRYRTLIDRLPVLVYEQPVGTPGRARYVSPQVKAIYGYTDEEWDASRPTRMHPDDRERVQAEIARTDASGEPFRAEYRERAQDGRYRWVRDEAVLIRDERGGPDYWLGVKLDISDRKLAEDALRTSEARFRAAADGSLDAFYLLESVRDDRGEIVDFAFVELNRRGAEMIRSTREAVIGQWLCELLPVNRTGGFFDAYKRVVETGEPLEQEFSIDEAYVDAAWLHHQVVKVGDGVAITSRDITQSKRLEAALREREAGYRSLVEHAPDMISVLTADGEIRYASPAIERVLGYRPEALIGSRGVPLVHPEDAATLLAAVDACLTDPAARPVVEVRVRHADGSWRWLEAGFSNQIGAPGVGGIVVNSRDVTDRRAAEAALAAERDLLGALMDALPDPVWVKDLQGRILRLNLAAARNVGAADPADAVGKSDFDFLPAARAAAYAADEQRVMATGKPILNKPEPQGDDPDGPWWLVSLVPFHDKDGRVVGVAGTGRDVTRQRRAEDALRRAERRYRDLFAEAPVMYMATRVAELGPVISDCNRMFWRTLGYGSRQEVVGRLLGDIFTPASRRAVLEDGGYEAALRGSLPLAERQLRTRDGQILDVLVQAAPDLDEHGTPRGTRAAFLDVTERKRLEADLREAEERYRSLVERLPAVVYLLEADGNQAPLYLSPRIEDILGVTVAEAMGRTEHWSERVHPDDRDRVAAESARSLATETAFRCEYRHRQHDGDHIWVRDECEAVRDADGRITAWHGVMFDVSDQHRLQDELVAARDAAEEASRLKSAFLSTMSHELRTPLNAVLGYAHLLLDGFGGDLTPGQRDDVGRIVDGAGRLLALVNDVLDLSRIGAGMLELEPVPVPLRGAVAAVAAEVAPLAATRNLALGFDVPPDLTVRADPLRLHQILLNLLGNAVKFTEAGSVTVAARAASDGVEIVVRDTGVGIPPDALPHVFDEFRQADGSTTRKYGGTGLGLAIVRKLVELHGGRVTADSEPGSGSAFTVLLPGARIAPEDGERTDPPPSADPAADAP